MKDKPDVNPLAFWIWLVLALIFFCWVWLVVYLIICWAIYSIFEWIIKWTDKQADKSEKKEEGEEKEERHYITDAERQERIKAELEFMRKHPGTRC